MGQHQERERRYPAFVVALFPTPDSRISRCDELRPPRRHWLHPHVARATIPRLVDDLAEILQNESRATLRLLTVRHHRPQLGAVLQAPLLVVCEIRAQIDVRHPLLARALPRAAAILAHEPMTPEQHKHNLGFPTRHP